MRRTLSFTLAGVGSLISGYGSRDLITEVTGRPPMWVSRLRGWSCQEKAARDALALATDRGYDVVITGPRSSSASETGLQDAGVTKVALEEQPDPAGGLW